MSSAASMESNYSFKSHASWAGRKGKKRKLEEVHTGISPSPDYEACEMYGSLLGTPTDCSEHFNSTYVYSPWTEDYFLCTWCRKEFKRSSDWKRHEETQHAPQTEWTCLAEGPEILLPAQSGMSRFCVLCAEADPPPDHVLHCAKQINLCINKPLQDRKFDRKDHLVQHLRTVHNFRYEDALPSNLGSWEQLMYSPGTAPLWDCGFCDKSGMTWAYRYNHVKEHVKDKCDWRFWRQCICTKGYSHRLRAALDTLGIGDIFARPCEQRYLPRAFDAQTCRKRISFRSILDRTAHTYDSIVHDIMGPYYYTRGVQFPIPSLNRPSPFWCGLCKTTVMVYTEHDAYECLIVNHIDRVHIARGDLCTMWKPIDLAGFEGLIVETMRASTGRVRILGRGAYLEGWAKEISRFYRDNSVLLGAHCLSDSAIESLRSEAVRKYGF